MRYLSILLVTVVLNSYTGPEGPQGPTGATLFSQVIEFEADFREATNYEVYFEFPKSIEVFEADLILVYLAYEKVSSPQRPQNV